MKSVSIFASVVGVACIASCGSGTDDSPLLHEERIETLELGSVLLRELQPEDLPVTTANGTTICGLKDHEVFESRPTRFMETFNFGKMNEKLAGLPELSQRLGAKTVSDCVTARRYVDVLNREVSEFEESPVVPPTEQLVEAEPEYKIHGGTSVTQTSSQTPQQGIVQLTSLGCTGQFITGRHILTAAHCVSSNGTRNLTYQAPGLASRTESFQMTRHPSYQSGHRSTDVAILRRVSGNLQWGLTNRFRLYTGSTIVGTGLKLYGYGAQWYDGSGSMTGTLRTRGANIRLNSHTDGYFHAYANTARQCRGDSGGPAVRELGSSGVNDHLAVVWGTASQSGHGFWDDQACPSEGEDQYWTKTNTNMGFIQDTLGFTCTTFSNADGTYASCSG